jgi:hypothetical protein
MDCRTALILACEAKKRNQILDPSYLTESSTAFAVSFTSRLTPRTVLAHEARKIAQTRAPAVKTRVMVMN